MCDSNPCHLKSHVHLYEYNNICTTSSRHLHVEKRKIFWKNFVRCRWWRRSHTPAIYSLFMTKNPLPLIDMSKLLICDISSSFAECNFSQSLDQKEIFSIFLINAVFCNTKKRTQFKRWLRPLRYFWNSSSYLNGTLMTGGNENCHRNHRAHKIWGQTYT